MTWIAQQITMKESFAMRAFTMSVVALTASIAVNGGAVAQEPIYKDAQTYASCPDRFAVIFPSNPSMRDVPYAMRSGRSVAARQHYLEQGADRFSVTVVVLANAPAVDEEIINHAADILRKQGEVRSDFPVGYIAGVRGRQLLVQQPNGRQLRGSVYMHDHRIYITEASTPTGDIPGLQFDQSITIIDAEGVDIDRGQTNTPQRVFTCR
jgi:hypothetical protein